MSVDTRHPLYTRRLPTWQRNTDAVEGEPAVKRRTTQYLPIPDPDTVADASDPRYQSYLTRAVFTNFTGRTVRALTGAVFRLAPTVELPAQIEYMREDADNNRLTLVAIAQRAVAAVMTTGRYFVMADYPEAPTNATAEQTAGLRAYIAAYDATQLINWHETNGQLDLVVLREVREEQHADGFDFEAVEYYRVMRLINAARMTDEMRENYGLERSVSGNVATIQLYRETEPEGPPVLLRAGGQPLDEIPGIIIGAEDNDPAPDTPPISDIASLNIAHYRNSADYEEGVFLHGQPMLGIDTGEDNSDQWAANNPGFRVGSRTAVVTKGGGLTLTQAEANSAANEAMVRKEEQMLMLGAQIIRDAKGNETAEGARLRSGAETSVLNLVVRNTSQAFNQVLWWCAAYQGGNPDDVVFQLNERFFSDEADPQLLAQMMLGLDRGIHGVSTIRAYERKTGLIDSGVTDDDLDAEVSSASPLVG